MTEKTCGNCRYSNGNCESPQRMGGLAALNCIDADYSWWTPRYEDLPPWVDEDEAPVMEYLSFLDDLQKRVAALEKREKENNEASGVFATGVINRLAALELAQQFRSIPSVTCDNCGREMYHDLERPTVCDPWICRNCGFRKPPLEFKARLIGEAKFCPRCEAPMEQQQKGNWLCVHCGERSYDGMTSP